MSSEKDYAERLVISVLVSDRVGILRDICHAMTDLHGNIDGIRQTVLEGYFSVILTVSFAKQVKPQQAEEAILARFGAGEAAVAVREYRQASGKQPTVIGERFVVTLTGRDRKGILKDVLGFLAEKGINVEDWFVLFNADEVTHIGDVTVPLHMDIKQLQQELHDCMSRHNLNAGIQHENIFRSTNDVGTIESLLEVQR